MTSDQIKPDLNDLKYLNTCEEYSSDYLHCKKFTSRVNQYYQNGQTVDCSFYLKLVDNCYKWQRDGDKNALNNLVEFEKYFINERTKNALKNDVWELRDKPPHDWNAPLPDWCQERLKHSLWYEKQQNLAKKEKSQVKS